MLATHPARLSLRMAMVLVGLLALPLLASCGAASTSQVLSSPPPTDPGDPPIDPETPLFSYPPIPELHVGTAMTPVQPVTNLSENAVFTDESPEGSRLAGYGLVLDMLSGEISGTPSEEATRGVAITIRATNGAEVLDAQLDITIQLQGVFSTLRLGAAQGYGDIPESILALRRPNDLSTSGQTYIKTGHNGTAVSGVFEIGTIAPHEHLGVEEVPTYTNGGRSHFVKIEGAALTSGYLCTQSDTEYILMGNMTSPDRGVMIANKVSDITINLNGHTIIYQSVGCYGSEEGTCEDWFEVEAAVATQYDICLKVSGLTNMVQDGYQGYMLLFTSGNEKGNLYPVNRFEKDWAGRPVNPVSSVGDVLRLSLMSGDIHPASVNLIDWRNGGPSSGDTFEVFDAEETAGVGAAVGSFADDVWIVNGNIIQGDGWGGANGANNENRGCAPISNRNAKGNGVRYIAGIYAEWHSESTRGFNIIAGGGEDGPGRTEIKNGTYCEYCTLKDTGDWIWNRYHTHQSVVLPPNSYLGHVRIIGSRHQCARIRTTGSRVGNGLFEYIEANQRGGFVNSSMITLLNSTHNTIRYCNLYGWSHLGHCLATHAQVGDNEIHDNWGEMSGYGWPSGGGTGFSNRWTGIASQGQERSGPQHFHDNVIIGWARSGDGPQGDSQTRVLWLGSMDAGHLVHEHIADNIVAAISWDGSKSVCTSTGGVDYKTNGDKNIVVSGGHFFSNHLFGVFGDNGYRIGNGWNRYVDVTFHKLGDEEDFHSFQCQNACEVELISAKFPEGGGLDDWDWFPSSTWAREVRLGYRVTVSVVDATGAPIADADITVLDKDGNVMRDNTYRNPNDGDGGDLGYITNAKGMVTVDVPVSRLTNEDDLSADPVNKTLCPLSFRAVAGTASGTASMTPSADGTLTITITD